MAGACWIAGASAAVPAGNVLELDGVNDHTRADAAPPLLLGDTEGEDFTIETFFFVPNQTDTEIQRYIWRGNSYGLFIDFNTGADFVNFRFWSPTENQNAVAGTVGVTTGWHHIAGVYDNEFTPSTDRFGLYLDGAELGSTTAFEFTPGINQGAGVHVFVGDEIDHVNGLMDEVRFSDSVRYSGSYTTPANPFLPDANTRALWHFDEACGSTEFQDSSGNANTLLGQFGAKTDPAGGLPSVPAITDTDPDAPSNDNNPEVKGTLENCASTTDVKVFTNATCSGTPATASVAHFTGPGITVNVPDNALTELSAKAVNATGDSACSASFPYTEDSQPPGAPTITGTEPGSPSNDSDPAVRGTASPDTQTVEVFSLAGCAGAPTSGTKAQFEGAGIQVSVGADQTTQLSARALDVAGNASFCSASLPYTEDSTAPETTIDSGPPSATSDPTPTFGFSSSEAGSTFACRIDSESFAPCPSPHTTAALAIGDHHFDVQAIDEAGNVDPTPAGQSFTVSAQPPAAQCADGSDNDGDGLTDFPADPGCLTASDSDESNAISGVDTTPPGWAVLGRRTQKLDATVDITAACGSTTEDCLMSASGTMNVPNASKVFRLKPVRSKLVPRGRKAKLRLRVPRNGLRAAQRALRKRRRISARVTVKVADAAGNASALRRVIKFKR